ncbi:MAG: ASCH domain-containing protein [Bacilli bacterium]|nr:ASCH domain-containing protein [Bacilli bacterium]MDD4809171.1 ASCH domain-containing protein [Bacilli bacterium]
MKVISIKQPWASLIVHGYKPYEYRSWKTLYRGELLIHASKTYNKQDVLKFNHLGIDFPTGCIIGKVMLEDCIKVSPEFKKNNQLIYGLTKDYEGYAWVLTNPLFLDKIYLKGRLNLWDYDLK